MANERRVRQNFIGGKLDAALIVGGGTLDSAALAAVPVIDATMHMPIVIDPDGIAGAPEIAYITAHADLATTATILRGREGTSDRSHRDDIPWVHGPTIRDFPQSPVITTRDAGHVTITGNTWQNLDTGLDIVLDAAEGDIIEVSVNGTWNNENETGMLDVATYLPLATPVIANYFGAALEPDAGNGLQGWTGWPNVMGNVGPTAYRTLVAGDLVNDQVTLRLRARAGSGGTKIMLANASSVFKFTARNLGPAVA